MSPAGGSTVLTSTFLSRYEALEARMETLRVEKRQLRDPPPQLMQKHADEIAALERRLAALQVHQAPSSMLTPASVYSLYWLQPSYPR